VLSEMTLSVLGHSVYKGYLEYLQKLVDDLECLCAIAVGNTIVFETMTLIHRKL